MSLDRVRVGLVARLRARRPELEEAIVARIRTVSEPTADQDAEYLAGLRAAVVASLDYSLTSMEQGEEWVGPIPAAAAEQARRAARYGVSLDTVLRRYAAGDRLLGDFVMDETDHFPSHALRQVLRTQGTLLDRLMASIATEYMHEVDRTGRSTEQRRVERVQRLLAGTLAGPAELDYELDAWHVGIIVTGARSGKATIDGLAEALGCQLLFLPCSDESAWAWLGSQRRLVLDDIERILLDKEIVGISLAVGESARGFDGWRLTHRQAQRALWVALRKPTMFTRYADVLLLASALQDDVMARSLNEIYLAPLADQRDGGAMSRETLRTYFAVGRNAATAAAVLKVDRHTVERRVHKIAESLGRSLDTCQAELEVALRLEGLSK